MPVVSGVTVVGAAVLRVSLSVLLGGAFMTGLASVAATLRARRLDREMREQERAGDAGFTVSFTGFQIYLILVWGLAMLALSVVLLVWGFFPELQPGGAGVDHHLSIPLALMVLAGALGFLMMLWWRTGMRLSIRGDGITLMRWHRIHRMDVSDLVSAEVIYGKGRTSGVENLKLGFKYPGSPRVHHMTLTQVVTHYGRLRIWLARHNYIPDDQ